MYENAVDLNGHNRYEISKFNFSHFAPKLR